MKTDFSSIIHGSEFNNLAAILKVAFHAQPHPHIDLYRRLKSEIPFWSLWKQFDKVTPIECNWNTADVIAAFTDLILAVTKAAPEILWYTEDDLNWFVAILANENACVTIQLFKAWVSADGYYLTPGQVAKLTGTSESNWRNRAAGQKKYKPIPGCKKPGKDWLIPLIVLQAQGEIPWVYKPDQAIAIGEVNTIPEHDPYHEGQCTPTTTALWIDPRDNTAGVSQELDDNATPMDEFHGRIITKGLDDDYRPDEDALKSFLEGIRGQELLAEICAAHSIEWDGNNLVGEMTADGWDALAALIDEIDALPSRQWGLWQVEEWLNDYAAEYIDADTTPAKIAELAAELEIEAKEDHIILDGDISEFLEKYQSEIEEED